MTDTIRILVIDDSEDDRELYRRALHKNAEAHYDITEAANGDDGLRQIEEKTPDCVLLDYSLPGRNGIEVLKSIHAGRPFLPVVMLTGQGNEAVAVTAMREGAQNYISKSTITPEAIQRVVRVAVEHCAMQKRIDEQRNSLEIFTRALAHDLKEPVRTITSFLDLLSAKEKLSEQGNTYFGYVKSAANRMHALIDTVHFYTRLDGAAEIPKEPCDVATVLQEAKENAAELIRERKPEIVSDPLPFVQANRAQLLQVLQNLLCNAIYHGDKNPRIAITVKDAGGFWALRVSDNGAGIAEADREKIFQPFTRLASQHGRGMGMGLAICKRIVESHGGTIRCEPAEGGGASFVFTLPKAVGAQQPAPSVVAQEEKVVGTEPTGLATVLLVDDNEADRELTQIMLTERAKLRCNFLTAQDAFEALIVLRKEKGRVDRVDLVLLDINMPGMSGLELLEKMRGEDGLKDVPVVICSTSSYDRDISQAKQLGALGYITKPTEMTKLEPLLQRAPGLTLATKDGVRLLHAAA